jgi:hypothetical protein
MTSTASALPTTWLAPPERLLPANHKINIQPIPIAISSTIAIIIGALVIILFSHKRKDMFLEDRIIYAPDNENPAPTTTRIATTQHIPHVTEVPEPQNPSLTLPTSSSVPPSLEPRPKLDAMLGLPVNSASRHNRRAQTSPTVHQSYYKPRTTHPREYDPDEETLNNWERNSAYLPYPRSDVSDDVHTKAPHWLEVPRDHELLRSTSSLSLASKTRLGDAY